MRLDLLASYGCCLAVGGASPPGARVPTRMCPSPPVSNHLPPTPLPPSLQVAPPPWPAEQDPVAESKSSARMSQQRDSDGAEGCCSTRQAELTRRRAPRTAVAPDLFAWAAPSTHEQTRVGLPKGPNTVNLASTLGQQRSRKRLQGAPAPCSAAAHGGRHAGREEAGLQFFPPTGPC